MYVTSSGKDSFIESIKQIASKDLKYISGRYKIAPLFYNKADNLAACFRDLLMLLGRGSFDKKTTQVLEGASKHDLESDLKKYFPSGENGQFKDIVLNIFEDMKKHLEQYDFKRTLVKESVPVCLLALANYSRQFFTSEQELKLIFKEIFGMLF